jgi:hypothetical protein
MFKNSKLFFGFMLIGSSLWLGLLTFKIAENLKAGNWPITQAIILSSDIKRVEHKDKRYILDIKYQYEISGNSYIGKDISNMNQLYNFKEANEQLKFYKENSLVEAIYNTENPEIAYLDVSVNYILYILSVVSFVMAIFSLTNLIRLFKNKTGVQGI